MDNKKFKNNFNSDGNYDSNNYMIKENIDVIDIMDVKDVKRKLLLFRKMDKIIEMMKQTMNCVIIESEIIDYNLVKEMWGNFISSEYNFPQINYRKSDIIDLAIKEPDNSNFFQDLLNEHFESFDDDLIMIYKKGCDKVLYLLKSESILYEDEDMPPYFLYSFDYVDIGEMLYDNELVIYYS